MRVRPLAAALLALGCVPEPPVEQPGPELQLVAPSAEAPRGAALVRYFRDDERAALEALAATDGGLASVMKISVAPRGGLSPSRGVLGDTRLEGGALRFEPRFAFAPGVRYAGVVTPFELEGGGRTQPFLFGFELPAADLEPTTEVTAVYPSAEVLPENLLKLYVHFSAPMRPGEAYERARLVDARGEPVVGALLAFDEELWDPERRRLTLLLDPGRIKRGLAPHEAQGPPLEAKREYRLVIEAAWRDARGASLCAGFEKRFTTGPHDAAPPDPAAWTLRAPTAGERDALEVAFDEPLDHALVERLTTVLDPAGVALDGALELGPDERSLRFVPAAPWGSGAHTLELDARVEDLCGNSLRRAFETAIGAEAADDPVRLAFQPR